MKTCAMAVCAVVLLGVVAHAEVIELEGTVKAVDAGDRTISIERKTAKGTKTLELEVNKKAGDLSALKVGDRISFSYDPDLELVTKIGGEAGTRETARKAESSGAGRTFGSRGEDICRSAVQLLEKEHYLQRKIDSDITDMMLDNYLRALDPWKLYLLQDDIDEIQKTKRDLPAEIKAGNLSQFYKLYDKFLKRVDTSKAWAEEFVAASHDFTKEETLATEREAAEWAKSEREAKDNWRKRIKYDLLVKKMEGVPAVEAKEALLRRYRSFAKRMQRMSSDELLESILTALATSFDPESVYMSPETMKNFEIAMKMQLDGIGAQLKGEDGYVTVMSLTPGGAAFKDGRLKPQDRIVGIGQDEKGEIVDVENMNLNEVVNLVRGKQGTVVRLKVLPGGRGPTKVYTITRDKIVLADAEIRGDVFTVNSGSGGKPTKIGVIVVPSFYMDMEAAKKGAKDFKSASRDCKALLDGFRLQNVECVILDLRNNGGGSLPDTVALAGLFLDTGRVLQIKDKEGNIQQFDDKEAGGAWDGPLVVLVNRLTSGAGEILAGAVKDHYRGLVVGDEATGGKATSASLVVLKNDKQMGSMKVAIACFYRPSGEGIQQRGLKSDIALPSRTDFLFEGKQDPKGALAFDRIPKAGFQPVGRENEAKMAKLRKQSEARLKKSEDFQKVLNASEIFEERTRDKKVSLVEAEFAKQWKAAGDDSNNSPDKPRNGIVRDYYLDEVMNIAADFAKEVMGK